MLPANAVSLKKGVLDGEPKEVTWRSNQHRPTKAVPERSMVTEEVATQPEAFAGRRPKQSAVDAESRERRWKKPIQRR